MASPLTVRLDEKTRRRIARLARQKKLSTSEVVRQAVTDWADRQEPLASPYEAMKDLIGVVHGGDPTRSSRTGERFRKLLKARRARS